MDPSKTGLLARSRHLPHSETDDITEGEDLHGAAWLSSGDAEKIFTSAFEGMYVVDRERRVRQWNHSAEAISGYSREQMIGNRCSDNFLVHVDEEGTQLCQGRCPLQATIDDGNSREARVYMRHKIGHRVAVLVRTCATRNNQGETTGAIELFRPATDCSDVSAHADELERLAFLDVLTNLPNRRFAENRLALLMDAYRTSQKGFSTVLIDLDHFEQVNDTYGHAAGDAVLKAVSLSFSNGLRSTDLVARWGGEEFIVLFGNTDKEKVRALAERCLVLVERTMTIKDNLRLEVTASVGAATLSEGDDLTSLLERMDQRLYQSKRAGRNRVTL